MTVCNTIERMSQFGFARTMDRFVSIRGNLPKWLVSGRRPAHTLPKKQPTDDRYFPLAELSLEGNPLEPPVLASISHALQQLSFREAGKGSVGGVGQEGVSSSLKILLDQNGWLLRGPLNTSFSRDSLVTRHTHTHTPGLWQGPTLIPSRGTGLGFVAKNLWVAQALAAMNM